MQGLRQQKKTKCRRIILESAREMFFKHGHEKTTIEIISKHAGVGAGTIYNYFASKAELYVCVMSALFEVQQIVSFKELVDNEEKSASEVIFQLISTYIDLFNEIEKHMMKELFTVILGNTEDCIIIRETMLKLDYEFLSMLKELLCVLVAKGKLKEGISIDECANVIFSIFAASLLMFVYDEKSDIGDVRQIIKKQIKFIVR
ncbi:MAG: TetR/AcrR family transcriptional regulator [Alkaliphilus sp.]